MTYRPDSYVQGDSFYRQWLVRDYAGNVVSLTGATIKVQIRNKNDALLAEGSTTDGRITVNTTKGEITLNIPHTNMNLVTTSQSPCYYDLEITFSSGRRLTVDRAILSVLKQHTT